MLLSKPTILLQACTPLLEYPLFTSCGSNFNIDGQEISLVTICKTVVHQWPSMILSNSLVVLQSVSGKAVVGKGYSGVLSLLETPQGPEEVGGQREDRNFPQDPLLIFLFLTCCYLATIVPSLVCQGMNILRTDLQHRIAEKAKQINTTKIFPAISTDV